MSDVARIELTISSIRTCDSRLQQRLGSLENRRNVESRTTQGVSPMLGFHHALSYECEFDDEAG
jgi:hypothetical protein